MIARRKDIDGIVFEKLVIGGANRLRENVETVNDLNVFPIPDGDTGDNMLRTISGGIAAMKKVTENSVGKKAKALSDEMLLNARGNSGVIFSQLFYGISEGLKDFDTVSLKEMSEALKEGVKTGYGSVIKPVEGTMLTVAREATDKVAEDINEDSDLDSFATDFVGEMRESLKRTPDLLAVLKEAGVVDSGGAGLLYMAEGAKDVINGKETEEKEFEKTDTAVKLDFSRFNENSIMEFGYCTEFLLQLQKIKVDIPSFDVSVITEYLKSIGDSLVVVKTGSVVKVHVHTLTPYKALEFAQKFGEFLTVKIENMTLQHNEVIAKEDKKDIKDEFKVEKARKKYGLCTVATGNGLIEIFKELGADAVIDGGQGKNPSVNDFIEKFEEINADNIFVLPNNSNIFMAAKSAAEIYNKSKVFVIESKNIGQAFSALSMLDYSGEPEEIAETMKDDIKDVVTGMVTRAVRDACLNGVEIKKDNYVGFTDKTMYSCDLDKVKTAIDLAKKLGAEDKAIMTVVYGIDATEIERKYFASLIAENFNELELYEIDGGQDIYDFIMIIE